MAKNIKAEDTNRASYSQEQELNNNRSNSSVKPNDQIKKERNMLFSKDQLEGYALLVGSIILFMYSVFGFLKPVLDFAFALISVGLALYAAKKVDLLQKVETAWEYLKNKYREMTKK